MSVSHTPTPQPQTLRLRLDFFPTPPDKPWRQRQTQLVTSQASEQTNQAEPIARSFVQCNCACK
jgi:hypothetical protein